VKPDMQKFVKPDMQKSKSSLATSSHVKVKYHMSCVFIKKGNFVYEIIRFRHF